MYTVTPGALRGTICAPSSKSAAHREYILSALAGGTSHIQNPLFGEDTNATLNALRELGAGIEQRGDAVSITGAKLHPPAGGFIDCKNAGTLIRFLAGIAARLDGVTLLSGDDSLCTRPMGPLLDALADLGADVYANGGCAPFSVAGPAVGTEVSVSGSVSSQFISALLISAPPHELTLRLTSPLVSAPYVEMTIAAMQNRGVVVQRTGSGFYLAPNQTYSAADVTLPGDYSSAAFFLAGAALCGDVTVENLPRKTVQGDAVIGDILKKFGANVTRGDDFVRVQAAGLSAADINLSNAPDLFPITCVLATQAEGTSRIYGAAHLKYKESNRIETTTAFLKSMGAAIRSTDDGAVVSGRTPLRGASVQTHKDHRIAMSACIAGLCADGATQIDDIDCAAVSYPDFICALESLKK